MIAGNRSLPLLFAKQARERGVTRLVAAAFEGETDPALARGVDCAVIVTAHSGLDYRKILESVPVLVDTRNCLAGVSDPRLFRL